MIKILVLQKFEVFLDNVYLFAIFINRKEGNDQKSFQDVPREKGRTLSNVTTIKPLQAESQKDSFFPKMVKRLSK